MSSTLHYVRRQGTKLDDWCLLLLTLLDLSCLLTRFMYVRYATGLLKDRGKLLHISLGIFTIIYWTK